MARAERRRGFRALAALLPKLTRPALRRRGFTEAELIARWPDIVGSALAAEAVPDRLAFPRGRREGAVLHVRVDGPAAVELQHLAPQVIERINTFFGYGAVARLALVQGPVERPKLRGTGPKTIPAPNAERDAAIAGSVSTISDGGLRAALGALGRAIAAGDGAASPDDSRDTCETGRAHGS